MNTMKSMTTVIAAALSTIWTIMTNQDHQVDHITMTFLLPMTMSKRLKRHFIQPPISFIRFQNVSVTFQQFTFKDIF